MDLYEIDRAFYDKGFSCLAGIDEAGRGPLAGPVVAAAVILNPYHHIEGLNDSKKLSAKMRYDIFWDILCCAEGIGVGVVDVEEIDRVNILNATKTAMLYALTDLNATPDMLLIDAISLPEILIKQVSIIKGDSKSASIAAASIIAKVVRDKIMTAYHKIYPKYGFKFHKGYCTKEHLSRINVYGICDLHRKSFAPIRNLSLPFQ